MINNFIYAKTFCCGRKWGKIIYRNHGKNSDWKKFCSSIPVWNLIHHCPDWNIWGTNQLVLEQAFAKCARAQKNLELSTIFTPLTITEITVIPLTIALIITFLPYITIDYFLPRCISNFEVWLGHFEPFFLLQKWAKIRESTVNLCDYDALQEENQLKWFYIAQLWLMMAL